MILLTRRIVMNFRLLLYASFIMIGTFVSAVSQVLLKKAANKTYENRIREYLNPLVIVAYSFFFGATLLSVLAYKVVPLSMGPILEATSYIYVTIFGVTIFKEKINKKKFIALLLIVVGICVYAIWGV